MIPMGMSIAVIEGFFTLNVSAYVIRVKELLRNLNRFEFLDELPGSFRDFCPVIGADKRLIEETLAEIGSRAISEIFESILNCYAAGSNQLEER